MFPILFFVFSYICLKKDILLNILGKKKPQKTRHFHPPTSMHLPSIIGTNTYTCLSISNLCTGITEVIYPSKLPGEGDRYCSKNKI